MLFALEFTSAIARVLPSSVSDLNSPALCSQGKKKRTPGRLLRCSWPWSFGLELLQKPKQHFTGLFEICEPYLLLECDFEEDFYCWLLGLLDFDFVVVIVSCFPRESFPVLLGTFFLERTVVVQNGCICS